MRFPSIWEDSVTMASESALKLFKRHPKITSLIRYFVSATETAVDMSKPIANYVLGCLKKAGVSLPSSLLSYQVQHACAAGSLGLLGLLTMLKVRATEESNEIAVLMCSDIARYKDETSAELTQGAGSASVLIEKNPQLLELDVQSVGMYSSDVDDFFRPTWSMHASVRGQFSVECYKSALVRAVEDYAQQCNTPPANIIKEVDFIVLHVPFAKMAHSALKHIYDKYIGASPEDFQIFLEKKHFSEGLNTVKCAGNVYTASIFVVVRDQLQSAYRDYGSKIVGKSVLMCSYGSGNTLVCMKGTVAPGAAAILNNWENDELLTRSENASYDLYHNWIRQPEGDPSQYAPGAMDADGFHLDEIRSDGYRVYGYGSSDSQPKE